MSTDSSLPSPDPNSDEIVSKKVTEVTEINLWELDFDNDNPASSPDGVPRNPGHMPAQRKTASNIRAKKPSDTKSKAPETTGKAEHLPVTKDQAEPAKAKIVAKEDGQAPAVTDDDFFADFPEIDKEPAGQVEEIEGKPEELIEEKPARDIQATGTLSRLEKIAITALCAILALGAILTVIHFYSRVPTRPLVAEEIDFPVSGKIIVITAADTYWRKPVMTGENADVVRRGTQLIPVLNMDIQSKSGVIRVFFRNEDGTVVGDGITRTVGGGSEVAVAATAGFDDVGMHTAYRTGDSKRWIVQVFEGPSATAPREKFRKVLETEVSTTIK
jgi:hypothetical protein